MHGEQVRVEAGLETIARIRPVFGLGRDDGALEIAERVPGGLLHDRVDGQLDGGALRVLAGDDAVDWSKNCEFEVPLSSPFIACSMPVGAPLTGMSSR